MAKAPGVLIEDWEGLQTNVDPNDAKPGMLQEQVNMTCVTPGQLTCRGGMIQVTFED